MTARLAPHLEAFFSERLIGQRHVSEHTVASYRDSFRLLLCFTQDRLGKRPSKLDIEDITAHLVTNFLQYVEEVRGNTARSRNARLAAIHSFFRFVACREPGQSALIQKVLSIPAKRFERRSVDYLTRTEIDALLSAPDLTTRIGRRDRALLLTDIQTGLRVSELVGIRCCDIHLGHGPHVRCLGKGRKDRCTPLRGEVVHVLQRWMKERSGAPGDFLFPSRHNDRLSRDAVGDLLTKYATIASSRCPSLTHKRVTPHVLRHTTAMSLLESGVDPAVISLWLGHESIESTQIYVHATLQFKEKAMSLTQPHDVPAGRFRPDDELLTFLEGL